MYILAAWPQKVHEEAQSWEQRRARFTSGSRVMPTNASGFVLMIAVTWKMNQCSLTVFFLTC